MLDPDFDFLDKLIDIGVKKITYPTTVIIFKTVYALNKLLRKLIETFPNSSDSKRMHGVRYPIFTSKEHLIDYFKETFPKHILAISND